MPWNEASKVFNKYDYGTTINGSENYYHSVYVTMTTNGTKLDYKVSISTNFSGYGRAITLYLKIHDKELFNKYYVYDKNDTDWNNFPTMNGTYRTGTIDIDDATSIDIKLGVCSSQEAISPGNTGRMQWLTDTLTRTWEKPSCTISNISISPEVIIPGGSVTASATGNSGSSLSYQWYNSSNIAISGATSATRAANDGDYCKITVTKSDYKSTSGNTSAVKHYGRPGTPSNLSIKPSVDDGRHTNRENYTFSWGASADGTNGNTVDGYTYWICANNDNTKITGTTNVNTREITKTASQLVSGISLDKGDKLYFKVQASGSVGYDSAWATSGTTNITSAAVMHVKNGSAWSEGIVYVNTGTSSAPNWVEATEVKIKDGTQWKDSI